MQDPTDVRVTIVPAIEHTEFADESIENVTGLPDAPPVAATV
jgi:hypothetical protein